MTEKLPEGFSILKLSESGLKNSGFVHRTGNPEFAELIAKSGFSLKKFGETAKNFGMDSLASSDPIGVYSTPVTDGLSDLVNSGVGFVCFEVDPNSLVLVHSLDSTPAKRLLMSHFEAKSSKDLTVKLSRMGVASIASLENGEEFILLDTSKSGIISAGIMGEKEHEVSRFLRPSYSEDDAEFSY